MSVPLSAARGSSSGRWVVGGMVGIGLVLAAFAFWFQWRQTRRCLDFFGSDVATAVNAAERVELWHFGSGSGPRRLKVVARMDVSRAPGIVHLRHALVEDASFNWDRVPVPAERGSLPSAGWSIGLAFWRRPEAAEPTAVLAFDVQGGEMTVVGRPGRVAMGRLATGLATWLRLVPPARPPEAR